MEQYNQEITLRKGVMSIFFLSTVHYESQKELTSFISTYKDKLAEIEKDSGKKTAEPGPRIK